MDFHGIFHSYVGLRVVSLSCDYEPFFVFNPNGVELPLFRKDGTGKDHVQQENNRCLLRKNMKKQSLPCSIDGGYPLVN